MVDPENPAARRPQEGRPDPRRVEPAGRGTAGTAPPGLLRTVLPGLLLVVLGVVGFALVDAAVREHDALWRVDQTVLEWFADRRTPVLTSMLTAVTTVFGPVVLPFLVAGGAALWWWRSGRWRSPALLVGAMLLSTLVSTVVKAVVARPRPPDALQSVAGVESSYSFPSGHTIGAATLVLVSGYLLWSSRPDLRRGVVWGACVVLVVGVVALSRLYLGYHFVTDVLAAVCLAVAVLGVVVVVDRCAPDPQRAGPGRR